VVQTFETTAMVFLESAESSRLPGLLILEGGSLILFLRRGMSAGSGYVLLLSLVSRASGII
jgi:hypothetical protein